MRDAALPPTWSADLLRFWFEELAPAAWFKRDDAVDRAIHARFLAVHEALARELPAAAFAEPDVSLAAIIALDQLPRNLFRGDARAFATDAAALALAAHAAALGFDGQVPAARRLFFYLPFEHAESAALQKRSVALIAALGDGELTRYAVRHQEIVDRFGRFPHRNAVLGRDTTPDEAAFLLQPGSSF